jgi:KDO2-lipid IV(A) lauroyltransferase
MNVDQFTKSRFGVGLGLTVAKAMPAAWGYSLAAWVADQLVKRKGSVMLRSVRLNQWVIHGGRSSPEELDLAAREVFRHAGRCLVDLYHHVTDPDRIRGFFEDSAGIRNLVERSRSRKEGTFLVTIHQSNFDLALLSLGLRGLTAQVLSYSNPTGGYQVQNQLRTLPGLEVTPINPHALHQAIRRMKQGGMVITLIDRPVEQQEIQLPFFGHPAALPTGHVRMALAAGVPVIVTTVSMRPDGQYQLYISEPIRMQKIPDPKEEIRVNAEAILKEIEGPIRQNPEQWLMFYPVWPDLLGRLNRQE